MIPPRCEHRDTSSATHGAPTHRRSDSWGVHECAAIVGWVGRPMGGPTDVASGFAISLFHDDMPDRVLGMITRIVYDRIP